MPMGIRPPMRILLRPLHPVRAAVQPGYPHPAGGVDVQVRQLVRDRVVGRDLAGFEPGAPEIGSHKASQEPAVPGPRLDPVLPLVRDHDGAVGGNRGVPLIDGIEAQGVVPGSVLGAERHEHVASIDDVERLARVGGVAAPRLHDVQIAVVQRHHVVDLLPGDRPLVHELEGRRDDRHPEIVGIPDMHVASGVGVEGIGALELHRPLAPAPHGPDECPVGTVHVHVVPLAEPEVAGPVPDDLVLTPASRDEARSVDRSDPEHRFEFQTVVASVGGVEDAAFGERGGGACVVGGAGERRGGKAGKPEHRAKRGVETSGDGQGHFNPPGKAGRSNAVSAHPRPARTAARRPALPQRACTRARGTSGRRRD